MPPTRSAWRHWPLPTKSERLRLWTEAAESAHRGLDVAVAGDGDADLRRRASVLARELESAVETAHAGAIQARREREIVRRIRQIQTTYILQDDLDEERAAYVDLMSALGIDVAAQRPAEVVRRIQETGIISELRQGLEAWAVTYIGDRSESSKTCVKLRSILDQLDPDPFRSSLRAAAFERRVEELLALAQSPEMLRPTPGPSCSWEAPSVGFAAPAKPSTSTSACSVSIEAASGTTWASRSGPRSRPTGLRAGHRALHRGARPPAGEWRNSGPPGSRGGLSRAPCSGPRAPRRGDRAGARVRRGALQSGLTLKHLGRYPEAEASLLAALRWDPDWPPTSHELGILAERQGRLDEAMTWFEKAIALDPEDWEYHHNLGRCLRMARRFEEAQSQLEQAIGLNPQGPQSYESLAAVFVDQGDHSSAVRLYDQALAVDPGYANAHYSRAIALVPLERFEEARESTLAALALKADDARYHVNLAQILTVLGRFDEALAAFECAQKLVDDGQEISLPLDQLIRAARGRGINERRLQAFLAGTHEPTDPREYRALAVLCQFKRTSIEESRLWLRAFALDATLTGAASGGLRYLGLAADAALRAGFGLGRDAEHLDASERERWFQQGIIWCRDEIAWWRARLERSDSERDRERLASWSRRAGVARLLEAADQPSAPADQAALGAGLRTLLDG